MTGKVLVTVCTFASGLFMSFGEPLGGIYLVLLAILIALYTPKD